MTNNSLKFEENSSTLLPREGEIRRPKTVVVFACCSSGRLKVAPQFSAFLYLPSPLVPPSEPPAKLRSRKRRYARVPHATG